MTARLLVALAAIFVVVTATVMAQTLPSHTLLGTVTDAAGARLPGVTVELTNPASTDSLRTVMTDANGRYRIERVVPGLYVLTFRLPGFAPVIRDLDIGTGNDEFEFDVIMQVGTGQPPLTLAVPAGRQRRVVCGLTLITPPNVDPKMVIPDRQPPPPQNPPTPAVKPMIRTVQPTMCWDPAPLAPSAPAR